MFLKSAQGRKGKPIETRLMSSSRFICSGLRCASKEPRLFSSCSSLLAPRRTDVTVGLERSQASATCARRPLSFRGHLLYFIYDLHVSSSKSAQRFQGIFSGTTQPGRFRLIDEVFSRVLSR